MLERMGAKQIHDFWVNKQMQNSETYKNLLLEQKELLSKLNKAGANAETIENYADYYFRGYDIPEQSKKKCETLRGKDNVHELVKRFM